MTFAIELFGRSIGSSLVKTFEAVRKACKETQNARKIKFYLKIRQAEARKKLSFHYFGVEEETGSFRIKITAYSINQKSQLFSVSIFGIKITGFYTRFNLNK